MTYFAIGMIYAATIYTSAHKSLERLSADVRPPYRLVFALRNGEGAGDAAASVTGAGRAAAIDG